jgi:hypothetical protein
MKMVAKLVGVMAAVMALSIGGAAAAAVHHSPAEAHALGLIALIALGMSVALGILRRGLVRRGSSTTAQAAKNAPPSTDQ